MVGFVNCFVIVCNMSQKVFRDCLDEKLIIRTVKGLFGQFYGQFKSRFVAACVGFFFFLWTLYMPQLALRVKSVITLLVITCLIIVVW